MGGGVEILSRILTSTCSLMTRLRKTIHTFVSEERRLYHNLLCSMSTIGLPQKLIANYSIRGLAVPRVAEMWKRKRRKRSYFNGSGSVKNMTLPLPHHSKKHTENYLSDIIFYSIY